MRGVRDPLDLEERLANLISDLIVPRLVPEIEILPWRRLQVLAVRVYPSAGRPHRLKREGLTGGAYVRLGSTNRRADSDLVEELRRFARGEAYDEQPMPGLDSEVLDFRAASESFAPFRKLARRDLKILRLVAGHQGDEVGRLNARKVPVKPDGATGSRELVVQATLASCCFSFLTTRRGGWHWNQLKSNTTGI